LLGGILNISKGGLVVYGAFFGGVAGLLLFVRKYRVPLLPLCDLVAPSMALGVAIGRIGCLMNGCCFGGVCDHAWAIRFPSDSDAYYAQVQRGQMYGFALSGNPKTEPRVASVRPDWPADRAGLKPGDRLERINGAAVSSSGDAFVALMDAFHQRQPLHIEIENRPAITIPAIVPIPDRSLPVHPTQIYSVIDGLALCLVLLIWSRFCPVEGGVFALLMTFYPITRFWIETLRSDEAPVLGTGMSISQNVSLALLVCAAALWFHVLRRAKRNRDASHGSEGYYP
jgi:phosphatidylglycerol:prolipoprotein diacylglycerol transferase